MPELFEIEGSQRQFHETIKVIGIGGGGGNALNHIVRSGVRGVEFIAANTDIAHLSLSEADIKIVLGRELTKGLGAGADPEIGLRAAEESMDEVRDLLKDADMVFLTAGMGGGTGTGATPIIAQLARENGSLVVAVATRPFKFEGQIRNSQALEGIENLRSQVDALIVIPNDRLLEITQKGTTLSEAFKLADEVLRQAVQGVTDLILRPGLVNVDFADVRTIMKDAGSAIMGIGEGKGEDRATKAALAAINSPLMDGPITGAKGILFNVTGGTNVGIHEIQEAAQVVTEAASQQATILWGHVLDPEMDEKIQITVIATGFSKDKHDALKPFRGQGRKLDPVDIKGPVDSGNGETAPTGKSFPISIDDDLDTPPGIRIIRRPRRQ